ncbi:MAG TPA: sulfotransferase [Povalibacter sp.]|nr:sulfotransferase [Povalibacter sp.]
MRANPYNPDQARQLLSQAVAQLHANDLSAAESSCRSVLALDPESHDALTVLGAVLLSQQRHVDALPLFEDLVRRRPSEPTHWLNLGTARRGVGSLEEALTAYMRAAQLGFLTADFYFNVGLTHLDRRDYESARSVLKRAVELAPQDALIRFEYVKACYESLQMDEAAAALEGWADFSSLSPEHLADLSHRMMNLGQSQRAEQTLRHLGAVDDLEPRARLTLVQILERTNRLPQAREMLDRLLTDPGAATLGADLLIAQALLAQREQRHEEAVELFRRALEQIPQLQDRHYALFPLAKSLDALRLYDQAFPVLVEAHESQIEQLKLSAPLAVARGAPVMEITRYSCDPADVAQWDDSDAPALAESPIFVVAFPRSGTTLLEQTLDAHPLLQSMDEQPLVQNALDDIIGLGLRYPEQLAPLDAAQRATLRARYFERAAGRVELRPGQRLVDKNPLNLLRLPVIRRLFPHSPIVLAIRHPCDVVLSCFMQHFRAPDFALLCADLETLATGFRRSFDFWYAHAQMLQPAVLEVRYEELVANFDSGARALADFLQLPWDDVMLSPAAHARAKGFISTPSYSQVVQPVNRSAVDRWKAYQSHLAPAIRQLQPCLARWGYSAS